MLYNTQYYEHKPDKCDIKEFMHWFELKDFAYRINQIYRTEKEWNGQ